MIKLNGFEIKPTIFPDKTSQVWKVNPEFIGAFNDIEWTFENEGEIVQVAQLKDLLAEMQPNCQISLELPYLPYGRQDKEVSNESTFALFTFAKMINAMGFHSIGIVDPHSELATKLIKRSTARSPFSKIFETLGSLDAISCFPDEGASTRYGGLKAQCGRVIFDKVRDQLTGNILGVSTEDTIRSVSYLIVDDICDGGKTFIEVAKALYAGGASEVHLYVSHGIFSKGTQVLRDAGIKRIFTYNGEIE